MGERGKLDNPKEPSLLGCSPLGMTSHKATCGLPDPSSPQTTAFEWLAFKQVSRDAPLSWPWLQGQECLCDPKNWGTQRSRPHRVGQNARFIRPEGYLPLPTSQFCQKHLGRAQKTFRERCFAEGFEAVSSQNWRGECWEKSGMEGPLILKEDQALRGNAFLQHWHAHHR